MRRETCTQPAFITGTGLSTLLNASSQIPLCSSGLAEETALATGADSRAGSLSGALAGWGASVVRSTVGRNLIQGKFRFIFLAGSQRFEYAARLIILNDAAAFFHILNIFLGNTTFPGHLLACEFLACAAQAESNRPNGS